MTRWIDQILEGIAIIVLCILWGYIIDTIVKVVKRFVRARQDKRGGTRSRK